MESTVIFLRELADRLDGWAHESLSGGWSTHQVQANIESANECRRKAAELERTITTIFQDHRRTSESD